MALYVLNVRNQRLSQDGNAVSIARQNLRRALVLEGRQIVLYRPSDETDAGYYAFATTSQVLPDFQNKDRIWIELESIQPFEQPVTVDHLREGGQRRGDMPFHTYARSIRRVSDYESTQLAAMHDGAPANLYEEKGPPEYSEGDREIEYVSRRTRLRDRGLRTFMLQLYGPRCVFTGKAFWSLDGRNPSTQVGHLVALEYGGPDIIQNVLPMSAQTNWHWDEGIISLTNSRRMLISDNACPESRALYAAGHEVPFISSLYWPKAELLEWHRDMIFNKGRQRGLVYPSKHRIADTPWPHEVRSAGS